MARPDLDDDFDEDAFVEEFGGDEPAEQPWHNSTRAVIGASAAGIAVIGVLVAAVMFVSGGNEQDTQVDFVDPSFSETANESASSATTTTQTITSTPQVSTTEINGPPPPPTTPGSSDTSATSSGNEIPSPPTFTRPRQRETDENGNPTTRNRPRLNVTRTLGPG